MKPVGSLGETKRPPLGAYLTQGFKKAGGSFNERLIKICFIANRRSIYPVQNKNLFRGLQPESNLSLSRWPSCFIEK